MINLLKRHSCPLLIVGFILIGTLCATGWVMARSAHGGDGMHLRMLWNLDLSAEQKAAIGQMLPIYRAEKDALREKMHTARETLHTLMTADALDESGIRETSRAMAPIMEEMAVLQARFMFDLRGILSPEQVAKLQARREDARERWHARRRFRQDMMDTWLQMPTDGSPGAAETTR
jgi:Spy/CpxP family protein refolding chaperone